MISFSIGSVLSGFVPIKRAPCRIAMVAVISFWKLMVLSEAGYNIVGIAPGEPQSVPHHFLLERRLAHHKRSNRRRVSGGGSSRSSEVIIASGASVMPIA